MSYLKNMTMNCRKDLNCYSFVFGLLAAFFLLVSGSHGAEETKPKKSDYKESAMKLERSNGWKLELLTNSGNEQVPVLKDAAITLLIQNGRVSGKSGCNRYFADYKVTGNELTIGKTASTMMACPEPLMKQERDFLEQLGQVKSYAIENGELHFRIGSGESVLVFSAVEAPTLTGHTWKLSSFNTGNAQVSNRTTEQITAEFSSQSRLSGFAGCNQYSCSYRIDGDRLELSPVITTRKFCHEPEDTMKTEAGFISALGSAVRYRIHSDELTLFNENDNRVLIFKLPE